MLLMVSIVFLLFNAPSHIIRVYMFVKTLFNDEYRPDTGLLITQNYTMHLFYANFASNFALYNASGTTFRRAMIRLGRRFVFRLRFCCSTSSVNDRQWRQAQRPTSGRRTVCTAPGGRDGVRLSAHVDNNIGLVSETPPGDPVLEKMTINPKVVSRDKVAPKTKKISLMRLKVFGGAGLDGLGSASDSSVQQKTTQQIPLFPCQAIVARPSKC